MKRLHTTLLLTLLMSMVGVKAMAYDAYIDGIWYEFYGSEAWVVNPNIDEEGTYWDGHGQYSGEVTIPSSVYYQGTYYKVTTIDDAFYLCSGLTSLKIPSSIKLITGGSTFDDCTQFSKVIISDIASWCNVELYYNYGDNPLYYAKHLYQYDGWQYVEITDLVIPQNVSTIKHDAFSGGSSFSSITISGDVTSIGERAFYGCNSLSTVIVKNATPPSITSSSFSNIGNTTLYVPHGSKAAYQAADYWKDFGTIIDVAVDDVFTAKTKEGVDMSFKVISIDPLEVQVGDGTNAAIDKSYAGKITIPSSVTIPGSNLTFTVSQIGTNTFVACNSMNSVEVPGTIKTIEEKAFYGCTNLQKVIVPELDKWCAIDFNSQYVENGTNPLEYAHYLYSDENTRITDLVIPSSANGVKLRTFYGIHLNSVTLPENCTYIGKYAFYRSEIGKVNVLSTLNSVGYFAFAYSTIGDINLPLIDDIKYTDHLDAGAFLKTKITNMVIPYGENEITCAAKTYYPPFLDAEIERLTIGRYPELVSGWSSGYRVPFKDTYIKELHFDRKAFSFSAFQSTGITKIYLPEGTDIVDVDMNDDCSTSYIYIPRGATTIKKISGFKHNTSGNLLSTIDIPESVTKIEANAFSGSTFNHLVIPKNIATIGDQAFYNKKNSYNYKSVTCLAQTPPTVSSGTFKNYQVTLYVPSGCKALYADATGWKNFKEIEEMSNWGDIIPFKDETIKNACLSIGDIDGDNELSVGEAAQVLYLNFELSENARVKIQSFDELEFFTKVKYIDWNMFANCVNMTSITLPESLETIDGYAFSSCASLNALSIPKTVTSITKGAFLGCSSLAIISVADGNTKYDSRNNCNAIIETTSNTLITGCKNTVIPNFLTGIAKWAFAGCRDLVGIDIPNSVTSIEEQAFVGCTSLTSVHSYIEEPFAINSNVFQNYDKETNNSVFTSATLYVPAGTKTKYEAADGWKEFKEIIELPNPKGHLIVNDLSICKGGKINLPVFMNNEEVITAFQFDVEVPQGITMTDVQLGDRKSDSHTVDFSKQADGSYRVIAVSLQKAPFSGNEGELISLMLSAEKDIEGGDYNIGIKNIVLTTSSKEKLYPADVNGVLTVLNIEQGDADGDGFVDVADIVAMIDYILDSSTSDIVFLAADMNADGEIDIFDVMIAINIVLKRDNPAGSRTRASSNMEEQAVVTAASDGIMLGVNDAGRFTAFQFDVEVADGMELTAARLNDNIGNHELYSINIVQNIYRVIGVSMDNSTLTANGNDLIELSFSKGGHTQISNIVFVTPQKSKVYFASGNSEVTGIGRIGYKQAEDIYDLSGRKVNTDRSRLPKGLYIINNKKVVIK